MSPVPHFSDTDHINRFLEVQENVYPQVLKELCNSKKTSHWMWFIFPQIEGLGHSPPAKFYSIKSIKEARDFIAHPVLGKRLLECANMVLNINDRSASAIFGYPDDLKLRSSTTLFNYVSPEHKVFAAILKKYFAGEEDQRTLQILKQMST